MVSTTSFLLLLPVLVYGKFTIDIDLRGEKPLIDIRGNFTSEINDTIREAFQITDQQLITAVTKYGNGTVPAKVYVKKTKELSNIYDKYNFYDIVRHVKPVLDIKYGKKCSEPEKLHSDRAHMSLTTSWKQGGDLSVGIGYDLYLVTDSSSKLEFSTLPGKTITAKQEYMLGKMVEYARQCTLQIDVQFESTLEGDVITQYPSRRNGHYFWAYDLTKIQKKAASLKKSLITEETITVVYLEE